MVPWENFVSLASAEIEPGVDTCFGKCFLPGRETEVIPPAVKTAAKIYSFCQNFPKPSVASGKHPFNNRKRCIMPLEVQFASFQFAPQEFLTKQEFLRSELKRRKLNFKWHDAPLSVVEGVFARGDRRLGKVLAEAVDLGCRFDSWGDHFSFSAWQKAFAKAGIDPRFYLRRRETDEILPLDHLDCGV